MTRIILATTTGLLFAALAVGCGGGEGEGPGELREPPEDKVAAPGSQIGAPQQVEEGEPGAGSAPSGG